MKKIILLAFVISITFISCKNEKAKKIETIKEEVIEVIKEAPKKFSNVIVWKGYKPTGTHSGTIDAQAVKLKFNDDKLVGGVVIFDMNSIKNSDIKDKGDNENIVKHLKSKDFFDVTKHATSQFKITKVTYNKDDSMQVTGDLTINGITKKINFDANVVKINDKKVLKSNTIKINRTDFGVKYKSKKFFSNLKDKFINDEFDITFKLELK